MNPLLRYVLAIVAGVAVGSIVNLGLIRTRLAAWKQGTEVPNARNAQLLSYLAVVVSELEEFLDPDVIPDWLVSGQHTLREEAPVRALREGQLAEVLQAANATEHGAYI
jgi:hypothetical protein